MNGAAGKGGFYTKLGKASNVVPEIWTIIQGMKLALEKRFIETLNRARLTS